MCKHCGLCPVWPGSYNGREAVPASSPCRKFMPENDLEALFEIITVKNVDTMKCRHYETSLMF